MGQNKGLIPFLGKPLIQRMVERLQPIASELIVVSNDRMIYEFLHLPIVCDEIPGQGALSGLYTSLFASKILMLSLTPAACDMPFINPALLQAELI
jgi:molybdopterin-guanine dinucleotide biosynthesis protein A